MGSYSSASSGAERSGVASSGARGLEHIPPFRPAAGEPEWFRPDRNKRVRKFSLEPVFDKDVTGGVMTFAW